MRNFFVLQVPLDNYSVPKFDYNHYLTYADKIVLDTESNGLATIIDKIPLINRDNLANCYSIEE